jgi:hypothetical protein
VDRKVYLQKRKKHLQDLLSEGADGSVGKFISQELNLTAEELTKLEEIIRSPLNTAMIRHDEMLRAESEMEQLRSDVRIAVVHHNTLNFPPDDIDPSRFRNQTSFNSWLVRNKFSLVLHGHQHDPILRGYTESHHGSRVLEVDRGFVSIGSPELDLRDLHAGYNIIQIEVPAAYNVMKVVSTGFTFNRNLGDFQERDVEVDLPFGEVSEDNQKLLREVKRTLYSGGPTDAIRRAVDVDELRPTHTDDFREALNGDDRPVGMYALSVFGPQRWLGNRIIEFQMPYAVDNLMRAVFEAQLKGSEAEVSHLFSKSVSHAISTATKNTSSYSLLRNHALDVLKTPNTKLFEFPEYHDYVVRNLRDASKSLSVFGSRVAGDPASGRPIDVVTRDLGVDVGFSLNKAQLKKLRTLREYVRILFWPKSDFLFPSAFDVIQFHELMQIPLLWIDPNELLGAKKNKRERIGYFRYDTLDKNGTRIRTHEWCHTYHRAATRTDMIVEQAWQGQPPTELKLPSKPTAWDEFSALLKCNKVRFAADVWFDAQFSRVCDKKLFTQIRSQNSEEDEACY